MVHALTAGRPLAASALVLLLAASPVRDQAAVVPRDAAKLAASVLGRHATVANLCEPCGETTPTFEAVGRAWARPWDADPALWEVVLNGQPRDLAYVFVRIDGSDGVGTYVNMALALGLPVVDVSPVLRIADRTD